MRWISLPSFAQAGREGADTKFSADGSVVASVNGGRLSHWDGRTGAFLGSATVDWEGDLAFAKGHSQLVFAGTTGSVLTWDLDPRTWLATACRLAGRGLTRQEWHTFLPNRPYQTVCQS
jgi:WD40 repeat protein